jgi:hypothetical protein
MLSDISKEEIETKYKEWQDRYVPEEILSDVELRDLIKGEIDFLSKMSVKEVTLFNK